MISYHYSFLRRLRTILQGLMAMLVLVVCAFASAQTTEVKTNTTWLPLAELLKKWQGVPWKQIELDAEKGNPMAQHYLGYCYMEGLRVAQNPELGAAWYQRALTNGYLPSANNLGFAYQRGLLGSNNLNRAVFYTTYAAERGFAQSQVNLGIFYRDGIGVPPDPKEALKWFRLAAEQGHPTAMVEIGRAYRFGTGVERNLVKAENWFQKAADKGDALAQLNLGLLYEEEGRQESAFQFYRLAADQHSAAAQYHLGLFYLEARVVERNEQKGLELVRAAADQEFGEALIKLADLYAQGIGEPRSEEDRPMQLLQRAHDYEKLVFRYEYGLGTQRDLVAAAQWYCRGALAGYGSLDDKVEFHPHAGIKGMPVTRGIDEHVDIYQPYSNMGLNDEVSQVLSIILKAARGDGDAALDIGNMYLSGKDVPQTPVKAWLWFTIAFQDGSTIAHPKLIQAESLMTLDGLKEAQRELPGLVEELERVEFFVRISQNEKPSGLPNPQTLEQ